LFVSISQVIGCEDRLRNDLYCVEWGVKLYSNSDDRRSIYLFIVGSNNINIQDGRQYTKRQFEHSTTIGNAKTVAALHQGAPGQMTWLEDPPPWLRPAYCFA